MILILTSRDDATTDHVTARLRPAEYVRLNTDDLPAGARIESGLTASSIAIGRRKFRPEDFSGVWYRRPKAIRFKTGRDAGARRHAAAEYTAALEGFLALIPESRWINHPARNGLAGHKLEQLRRARALGFDLPPTLITQDPASLRKFWRKCKGDLIVKPLWMGYIERTSPAADSVIYTNVLRRSDLSRTSEIRRGPSLFQARVAKTIDLRVTIIDRTVHAVELSASDRGQPRLDIRRDNMRDVRYQATQLPAAILRRLHRLMRQYGLRFAAIDLLRDDRGCYIFLEVNPNGQWAWLDQAGSTDIRRSLITALRGA